MKKVILLLTLWVVSVCTFSQTVSEKLDTYFTAANKTDIFNGSVLITNNGKVVLNKGYGYKNVDSKLLNNENTIYQIGSVTKQFTSVIILKLAEQGKLSLNDKLSKYFPDLPSAEKITIENLLSHTSGIWNYTNDANFMQTRVDRPLSRDSMLLLIKYKPLDFEPGIKYSYSNSGYMLLGYIIEKVTGKKYEQVVRQTIFQPLGMSHSGFDFTHLQSPDKATGYSSIISGKGDKSMIVDSSVSFSAGAIYTTVDDLRKWNQSLTTSKILQPASLQNAFTPRLSHYGLGWLIDTMQQKRVISHNGGIHGFLSSNVMVPADSINIILLSNSNGSKLDMLKKNIAAILYNQPYDLPGAKAEVKIEKELLQQYVGEYELAPTFKITISLVNDGLMLQATGQPQFPLYAKAEDHFFLKVVDAQVEFFKDDNGAIEKMILHQNGQHIPGKKIK